MTSLVNNQGWGYTIYTDIENPSGIRVMATNSIVTKDILNEIQTPENTINVFTRETSDYLRPETFNLFKSEFYNYFSVLQTYNKTDNTIVLNQEVMIPTGMTMQNVTTEIKSFTITYTTNKEVVIASDFNNFLDYLESMFTKASIGVYYFKNGIASSSTIS